MTFGSGRPWPTPPSNAAVMATQGAGKVIQTINQYFPATSPYYSKAIAAKYPTYNPTKAKAILQRYINDATPLRRRPVSDRRVAVQLDYLSGDPPSAAAVQVAQQEWDAVGFK